MTPWNDRVAMSWESVRCVVFDFDGTLVDSNAIKRDVYFEILADVRASAEVVERVLVGYPGADRHRVLALVHRELASRPGLPPLEELVCAYSRLCEERVSTCPALPGAAEALAGLVQTYALYLDSATPTDALTRIVALRGWQNRFRGVLGAPASKCENLVRIAEREGVAPSRVLYVGDGRVDREAALEFGGPFFGYHAPAGDLRESPGLSVLAPLVDEIAARSGSRQG